MPTRSKSDYIELIKITAEENSGKPLGLESFIQKIGIYKHDVIGVYWSKWSDALIEAGYQPNQFSSPKYEDDYLIQQFIKLCRDLQHFPVRTEINLFRQKNPDFPSHSAFDDHFGHKDAFVAKIRKYCIENQGYEDIVTMCDQVKRSQNQKNVEKLSSDLLINNPYIKSGFVYLIKSEGNYKIGKSKKPDWRAIIIDYGLPSNSQLIHKIETDDQHGIERYWHSRFKDKRVKGEWFALSASDISAFRKRKKFM